MDLIPVVLNLSVAEDIDARMRERKPDARLLAKTLRLCRQAHKQGGLLSNCDLAELLNVSDARIAQPSLRTRKRDEDDRAPSRNAS